MALDGPKDDDSVFEESGFSFCINNDLLAKVEGVTLDLTYMGFALEPRIPLAAPASASQCGGCSSATTCSV